MPIALPKRIPISFLHSYTFFPSLFSAPFLRHTKFHPWLPKAIPTSRTLFFQAVQLCWPIFTFTFLLYIAPQHTSSKLFSPHAQLSLRTAHALCPLCFVPILRFFSKQPRAIINRPGSKMHNILFLEENFYSSLSHIYGKRECFSCCKRKLRAAPTDVPSSDQALRHNLRNSFNYLHYIRSVHRI